MFWDADLDLLAEMLGVLEKHLAWVVRERDAEIDHDAWGNFECGEQIAGLGFVACQAYITAICGRINIQKRDGLSCGPCHRSGRRIAEIVNHAANYCKHHEEWQAGQDTKRQGAIREAFAAVGVAIDSDYPLSNVLSEVTAPGVGDLTPLVAMLAKWRDELRGAR